MVRFALSLTQNIVLTWAPQVSAVFYVAHFYIFWVPFLPCVFCAAALLIIDP
jgi:hypothetical protein